MHCRKMSATWTVQAELIFIHSPSLSPPSDTWTSHSPSSFNWSGSETLRSMSVVMIFLQLLLLLTLLKWGTIMCDGAALFRTHFLEFIFYTKFQHSNSQLEKRQRDWHRTGHYEKIQFLYHKSPFFRLISTHPAFRREEEAFCYTAVVISCRHPPLRPSLFLLPAASPRWF